MKVPHKKSHEKRKVSNTNIRAGWIAGLLVAVTVLFIVLYLNFKNATPASQITAQQPTRTATKDAGQDRLLGRWMRSDGGYVIEIRNASADGKLEAAYFNPNPIHVGGAVWFIKENKLIMEVELQDANYPGSTYTLELLTGEDKMIGNYYQAVEGVNYDVEFVREK